MIGVLISLVAAQTLSGVVPTEADPGSVLQHPRRARIPETGFTEADRGRVTLRQYARCLFASSPQTVVTAVHFAPGEDSAALDKLLRYDCVDSGSLQFSRELLRGALFTEMYRRHESRRTGPWTYPVQAIDFAAIPNLQSSSEVRVNYFLLEMADCVYAKHPDAVRAVVMEDIASRAQNAAFVTVIAGLGPCIPNGVKLELTRTVLDGAFGEYMYRTLASKLVPATGKPK